jgi:hypothetical protein
MKPRILFVVSTLAILFASILTVVVLVNRQSLAQSATPETPEVPSVPTSATLSMAEYDAMMTSFAEVVLTEHITLQGFYMPSPTPTPTLPSRPVQLCQYPANAPQPTAVSLANYAISEPTVIPAGDPNLRFGSFDQWVSDDLVLASIAEVTGDTGKSYIGFLNIQTGTFTKLAEGGGLAPYYSTQNNMLYYWRADDKMLNEEGTMVIWDMWRYAKPIDAPLSEKGTPFWREESLFNPNPQPAAKLLYDETRQQWWSQPLVPANSPSLLAVTDILQAQTLDVSPSQWFYPKFTRPEFIEQHGEEITQVNPHFQALFQPNGNKVLFLGIYWSILYDLQSGQACELDLGKLDDLNNSEFQAWAHYATWSPDGRYLYLYIPKFLLPIKTADYRKVVLDTITGKSVPVPNLEQDGQMWFDEQNLLLFIYADDPKNDRGVLFNVVSQTTQDIWANGMLGANSTIINSQENIMLTRCLINNSQPHRAFCKYAIQK